MLVRKTILSCQNIRNGRVKVVAKMLRRERSSSSRGAIASLLPDFLIFCAFRTRRIGPYVSGQRNSSGMKEAPATITPSQKAMRQPAGEAEI